jgi:sugar lactone lactonase YvrE
VAVDAADNIYVSDAGNYVIRKVTPAGLVTTLAGSGVQGSANGTGTNAQFNDPEGLTVDANTNVYVADINLQAIRKITPQGVVTTVASMGYPNDVAVVASGNLFVVSSYYNDIAEITTGGVASDYAGSGSLYVSGSADGLGQYASFYQPRGVGVDAAGNVYVADYDNNAIRKITTDDAVHTIGGLAGVSSGLVDGTGSAARFSNPTGVKVDASGNVFVADYANGAVRIGTLSPITFLIQPPSQWVALAGDNLHFTNYAVGLGPLSYQWSVNGTALATATSSILSLPNVSVNQSGTYTLRVTNNSASALGTPISLVVQPTAAATLLPPTVIPAASGSGGGTAPTIQFAVQAVTGATYTIQVSTDLVNWTTIATYTAPFTFTASDLGSYAGQFYRVLYLHR